MPQAQAPKSARDAYAHLHQGAADRAKPSSSAGACGRRALAARRPPTAMRSLGSNNTTQQHLRHRRRRRLSLLAGHAGRLCAGRRRHQFLGRQRISAAAAPTCSRPARSFGTMSAPAYLTGALAYGWQDITTDRTVTVAGIDRLRAEFNANAWSGRVEGGYRFVTPWVLGITPYAAGQFTTFDLPAYAEQAVVGANTFALAYDAKNVTAPAANSACAPTNPSRCRTAILTLRGRAAWAHDFNPNRTIARDLPDAAGRELRRQRRGDGIRRRARHRVCRNEMAQRLVGRRRPSRASSPTSPAATPARAWCATLGKAGRRTHCPLRSDIRDCGSSPHIACAHAGYFRAEK